MEEFPNDLNNIVKDYIIFKPKTKEELQEAVNLWCDNRDKALNNHGHISNWDTSLITDMSKLFKNKEKFNDDINNWDVSSVTNMSFMFFGASSFNHSLNSWNVSSVTSMCGMFSGASIFNKKINSWDVSSVTDMSCMFEAHYNFNTNSYDFTSSFNQPRTNKIGSEPS